MLVLSRLKSVLPLCLLCFAASLWPHTLPAEVTAVPANVDFGQQRQEQFLKKSVTLTNSGKAPVEIVRVSADCACTAAAPQARLLEPGQSTQLDITFETRSYQGEVRRRVMVQTSKGDVTVQLRAVVSAYDHWMLGAPMAVFPGSNKGTEENASMTLQYTGPGSADVLGAEATVPWLKVRVEKSAGLTTFLLTKAANAPAGTHQPKVRVRTTDEKEAEVTFTAFTTVYSSLVVNPNPIILPASKVGDAVSVPVTLSGWEAKENPRFEIDDGTGEFTDRDGPEVLAHLSLTPRAPGTSTRLLRIFAGAELEAEVPVIVRAE